MVKIPSIIKNNIDNYVKYGYPPGGFCEAVLCDKLHEAMQRADLACRRSLLEIVVYVKEVVPPEARGSYEAVNSWHQKLKLRHQDPRCVGTPS